MQELEQAHTVPIRVRYVECDPQGVVHHSQYAIWLEIARTELLRKAGFAYKRLEDEGMMIVVAKMSLTYKRPAVYDDELEVTVRLKQVTGAKIIHEYDIRRDGLLLVTAETVLACVDSDGRIRRVPDIFNPDNQVL